MMDKPADIQRKKEIESILFVAAKPVHVKDIAGTLALSVGECQTIINELSADLIKTGIRIVKKGDQYQMVSAPENAKVVSKFLNEELRGDLTKAALETLALVFYKQPVTRIDVEMVRGVHSGEVLRQLAIRGLVQEVGRKESLGRPILYGTTHEFLNYLGLSSEEQLPKLTDLINAEG